MKVVEDFESRPDNAVTVEVEIYTEIYGVRRLKMPKALPSHSAKRKVEKKKIVEREVMNAVLAADQP